MADETLSSNPKASPSERLRRIVTFLEEQAHESPFTREEWDRVDKQTAELNREIERLRAALELSAEQTCEFGAGQPDDCGECYSCKAREALRGEVETSHD